jgi:hypothetical protein
MNKNFMKGNKTLIGFDKPIIEEICLNKEEKNQNSKNVSKNSSNTDDEYES